MTKTTFGEQLKREREMRGVSLEEVSAGTRIGMRFLRALENEQWEHLPGGVFNRGFVRAVSRFLGLDEESMVAEYALAANHRPEVAAWARTSPAEPSGTRWGLWLAAALILAAVGAGGWFASRYSTTGRANRAAGRSAPATQPPTRNPASPLPAAPARKQPASDEARPTAPLTPSRQAGQPVALPPATGAAVAGPATLKLVVAASKTAPIRVIADGKTLFHGKMSAGQSEHFKASDRFVIRAGDASALSLELNGQTVAPMGPPRQRGKITLTRKDLKKSPGGLH
jgi:cytoskeletal protein RodZ